MPRLICLLLLAAIACEGLAETESFWVIGSYTEGKNALAEQTRLAELLLVQPQVRRANADDVYRIMIGVEQIEKQALDDLGIAAWSIQLTNLRLKTEPIKPDDKSEPETNNLLPADEVTAQGPSTDRLLEYPDFGENESLGKYCLHRSESRLCRHPKVIAVLDKEQLLEQHKQTLKDWCNQLSGIDAQEICDQQTD